MIQKNINFTFDKSNYQHMRIDEAIRISSDTVNYVTAHFDIDEQWNDFTTIYANWHTPYEMYQSEIDASGNTVVPSEILDSKADVRVNLQGDVVENGTLTKRFTTYSVKAIIVDEDIDV